MAEQHKIRIDKWLWAVRIFKSRSQAAGACKKSRVNVGNIAVKPSRMIAEGDLIQVRKSHIQYRYRVSGLPGKRLSARLAAENYENITPPEEFDKLKTADHFYIRREKGSGRPTKKERRLLDRIRKKNNRQ